MKKMNPGKYLPLALITLFLSSSQTFAAGPLQNPLGKAFAPLDKTTFCERTTNKRRVAELANEPSNLTGFDNDGGMFNATGVCWWHSRLQRAALYLTVFHPERPAPSATEVHEIFKALKHNERVVEIGGFNNWSAFTLAYQSQIQRYLNQWQNEDAFIRQAWINGLENRKSLKNKKAADRLEQQVREIANEVLNHNQIVYAKLPMKFPTAHAWLIYNIVPVENGYDFWLIDSNFSEHRNPWPQEYSYSYRFGDKALDLVNSYEFENDDLVEEAYGKFSAYPQREKDFDSVDLAIQTYCQ